MIKKCLSCGKPLSYQKKYCSMKCYQKVSQVHNQIGKKNPMWKDIINKKELKDLYLKEKRGVIYISKMFGCSDSLIRQRLKKWKIKIRNYSEQIKADKSKGRNPIKYKGLSGKDNPSYKHGKMIGQKKNRAIYLKIAKDHFKWECDLCGKKNTNNNFDLVVHHIDGNNKNNDIKNMQILCQSCHSKIHHPEIRINCIVCGKKVKTNNKNKKYCSKKCMYKFYWKKLKSNPKKYKEILESQKKLRKLNKIKKLRK